MLRDLTVVLNIIGLGQALILVSLLWRSSGNWRASNRFLAIVLFSFSLVIINTIVRLSQYKAFFNNYEFLANACVLLIAPSLFLYVKSRLQKSAGSNSRIHYFPFFLYSAVLVVLFLLGQAFKVSLQIWERIGLTFFHLQFGIYLYFIFKHFKQSVGSNSTTDTDLAEGRNHSWLKRFLIAIAIAWFIAFTFFLLKTFAIRLPDVLTLNVSLIFVLIVGQMAYKSYRLPNLFQSSYGLSQPELSNTTQQEIEQKLNTVLQKEKIYLDSNLSLHELAKHCQLPARQLSQYLNQHKQVHFFDYINTYRVEHLKTLLASSNNDQYTIHALAERSGFRSISTTYSAFKKTVGKTPAQFKKEHRE